MRVFHVTIAGNAQEAFRDTIGIKGVDLTLWSPDHDGLSVEAATRWGSRSTYPRLALLERSLDSVEVNGKNVKERRN